ncbi:MAG: hypothetical protein ACOYOK_08390 [Pseudobdellovibrionaceae bacterium]
MKSLYKSFFVATLLAVTLPACKQGSTDPQKSEYIDHIKINKGTVSFEYITTFSNNLEVDMEGEFPINKYGSVVFYNDAQGKFNIGLQASLNLFGDLNLTEATALPNGARFPVIVTGSLYSIVVSDVPGKYKIVAYVDKPAGSLGGAKLAGVALQLENIKNSFPQVSITQSFFKGNAKYASFTLYGPRQQGDKVVPGGLFLVGDINAVIDGSTNLWINQPTVWGPQAKNYKSDAAKYKLFKQAQKVLATQGIKLKF